MASSRIKSNALDRIVITNDTSKSFLLCVSDEWDKFPKGVPFQCCMALRGAHYVSGFIYNEGAYGRINIFDFNTGDIEIVKRYNGTFSYARIQGTSITPT